MSPAPLTAAAAEIAAAQEQLVGPDPSVIQVAKPFVFERTIEECMKTIGSNAVKEDSFRLQGVSWIESVRRALHLPVRTYNTAVIYYHKFRLVHPDNEYSYIDAAGAALFTACKIEDTLKKSKDILCAAYNMKVSQNEQLSPDDPIFEAPAKTVIGLERLMLESSGFDFRNRQPQKLLLKFAKQYALGREPIGKTAYHMCIDLYRTFAPLKQSSSTMAFACLELAVRMHDEDPAVVFGEGEGFDYARWSSSRVEVMETLLDLLDLYTHHRAATTIGPKFSLESFIAVRITLNQQSAAQNLPRFTEWSSHPLPPGAITTTNGIKSSPSDAGERDTKASSSPSASARGKAGERAQGGMGTVRFMLDAARARDEKVVVEEHFRIETEEYEVEVEREVVREVPSMERAPQRHGGRERERDRDRDRDRERGRDGGRRRR